MLAKSSRWLAARELDTAGRSAYTGGMTTSKQEIEAMIAEAALARRDRYMAQCAKNTQPFNEEEDDNA